MGACVSCQTKMEDINTNTSSSIPSMGSMDEYQYSGVGHKYDYYDYKKLSDLSWRKRTDRTNTWYSSQTSISSVALQNVPTKLPVIDPNKLKPILERIHNDEIVFINQYSVTEISSIKSYLDSLPKYK